MENDTQNSARGDGAEETGPSDYIKWKGWVEGSSFSRLSRGDSDYFDAELREARRGREVKDVLEVGFGNGTFLGHARARGWNAVGLELLPELVEEARAAGFEAHPAEALQTLPEASFDAVVAFDVFEHIDPDESVDFLRSCRRLLRPGGAIVLRYPNADSPLGLPYQNGDPTHVNAIGVFKLQYYAEGAQLSVERFRGSARRGFSTSLVHGLHRITAGAVARVAGEIVRAVYFPGLPVVLWNGNVVAVLRRVGE